VFASRAVYIDLEDTRSKIGFRLTQREAANYRACVRGVWEVALSTLLSELFQLTGQREIQRKAFRVWIISDICVRYGLDEIDTVFAVISARHPGLHAELTEFPHQFRVDRAFRGVLRFGVLRCRCELR
jgi:hypothetical protein